MVEVDVITVTAYQCVHCKALFLDRGSAFIHLDTCDACNALAGTNYIEKDFGNMILKEAVV